MRAFDAYGPGADTGAAPLLIVDDIAKEYPVPGARRLQRMFARLGGISPGEPFFEDGGDDDDDEDDEGPPERPDDQDQGHSGRILSGLSFTAQGGSCVGIVGGPGSGKSVLLKILAGVIPPSSGRVIVQGTIAPALDSLVGLLPKSTRVDRALPVLAGMLRVPVKNVRHNMPAIAELYGAPDFKRLDTSNVPSRRARELLLATMLCVDADVILVDVGLPRGDAGDRYLQRLLAERDRGALVLVAASSHESLSGLADRVLELRDGQLVGDSESDSDSA